MLDIGEQLREMWAIPGIQVLSPLCSIPFSVCTVPVGPDGIMEPAAQGSRGLGENAHEVLTTCEAQMSPSIQPLCGNLGCLLEMGNKTSPSKELVPKDPRGNLPRMSPRQEISALS